MSYKINYTEHIVSFVSVVLAALSISTLDKCVYHPELISIWAMLLFVLGAFFIFIINIEKMLEYVSSKGVYISSTYSYLQRFIPKIDDYKFWIFSCMNSILLVITVLILINLVAKVIFNVFNVDFGLKEWISEHHFWTVLFVYFLYFGMPLVIIMYVAYNIHKILHREDMKNKLVVWFNESVLELHADEPKELVMYLRNLLKESIQIKNIILVLPKDVILIMNNDEYKGKIDLKEVHKDIYCFKLEPMEIYGFPLELRYEPQLENNTYKIDSINFTIETDKFKKEVVLPVKLVNY